MDATSDHAARPTVLVVEDNISLLDMLRRTLEQAGFAVVAAQHGQDALARFWEHAIDIVVTDALMPKLDGFELIRILASQAPGLPIVAMSGIVDTRDFRDRALQAGAKVILSKPVNRAELVAVVRRLTASALT
jgi:CheY-like chemotaxis protein